VSQSHRSEPDPDQTPGVVIGAVAAATVVVPFLIVYALLFIAHGVFVTPEQPDITDSRHGEALAGLIAVIFLVFVVWGMSRMLNGSNRIVFWLGQVATAATALYLLLDDASGQRQIPAVVLLASLLALGLSVLPPATRWVRGPVENGRSPAASTVETGETAAPVAGQG